MQVLLKRLKGIHEQFLSQALWLESLHLSNLPINYIIPEFSQLKYMFTLVNHHYITAYVIDSA